MCDWCAITRLGAYLGLEVNDTIAEKLSSSPGSGRLLELVLLSKDAFGEKYPGDTTAVIARAIFETDFSRIRLDGRRPEDALSPDVFRRAARELEHPRTFDEFDQAFQRYIRWFKAALEGIACLLGLKKESISLEGPGAKSYIAELKALPCKGPGQRDFSYSIPATAGLCSYIASLLERYEDVLPRKNREEILEIMGKVSGHPGYFVAMDLSRKLAETKPLLTAISQLQLYPRKEPAKADLVAALCIMLFNVFPAPRLLKFIARFEPSSRNEELSYDYNAILAMNFMLMGKADEAAAHNEKAMGFAGDEEKRAYTRILDGCIRLSRRDFDGAIGSLYRCSSSTSDRRMSALARFYLGIIYFEMGNAAEALECFELSRPGLGEDLDSMGVRINAGICAMLQGDLDAAVKALEGAVSLGRHSSGNTVKFLGSTAHGCLGIVRFSRRDYDRAMGHFKEALRLHRETHNRKGAADQLGNIGLVLKAKRAYQPGLEYFKSALSVSFSEGYLEGVLFAYGQIEQLMALEGKYGDTDVLRQDIIRRNPGIAEMLKK